MRLFGILCILGLTAYGQAADRTPRVQEDSSADQQEEELTPHQIEILEESADLFAKYDANSDGGVTLEEMVAAAQQENPSAGEQYSLKLARKMYKDYVYEQGDKEFNRHFTPSDFYKLMSGLDRNGKPADIHRYENLQDEPAEEQYEQL